MSLEILVVAALVAQRGILCLGVLSVACFAGLALVFTVTILAVLGAGLTLSRSLVKEVPCLALDTNRTSIIMIAQCADAPS